MLVNLELDFHLDSLSSVTLEFWTQELYSDTRSITIAVFVVDLPRLGIDSSNVDKIATPTFTHTNLAFTSILTRATPVCKTDVIT